MSSASVPKLFFGVCSVFKCSFDEIVGEKVVSPSYSFVILGPPLEKTLESPLVRPHSSAATPEES